MKTFYLFLAFITSYTLLSQEKNYRKFIVNSGTEQKKGIALVVANNNYEYTTNLKYALQDGKIFGAALQEMNYDVQYGFNLNKSSMLETLQSFASKLNEYQNAIIYYSGHGLQFNGRNFIAPSDTKGTNEFELKNTSIDAGDFLQVLEQFQIPKAIILDACRENPFLKDLTSETRSVKGLGLAEIKATKNSIIVYSTAPNTVVPDDNQFTEIFAENIKTGGCIDDVLRKVRIKVQEHDENQLIFSREALLDNICFGEIDNSTSVNIDNDNDGVINKFDKCPDVYGVLENHGCPPYGKFVVSHNMKTNELTDFLSDEKKIEVLVLEANNNNQYALYNLGLAYWKGIKFDSNLEKAIGLLERSAYLGNGWAYNLLGHINHCNYSWSIEQVYSKSFEYFTEAANKNNTASFYNLGISYLFGFGIQKNKTKAIEWFKKSALSGHQKSSYYLAELYYNAENWEEAIIWLNESTKHRWNHVKSRIYYLLGELYLTKDGYKDLAKSFLYFNESVKNKRPYVKSYYFLGLFYKEGKYVDRNKEIANKWFKKGCDSRDNKACREIPNSGIHGSSSVSASSYKPACYTIISNEDRVYYSFPKD